MNSKNPMKGFAEPSPLLHLRCEITKKRRSVALPARPPHCRLGGGICPRRSACLLGVAGVYHTGSICQYAARENAFILVSVAFLVCFKSDAHAHSAILFSIFAGDDADQTANLDVFAQHEESGADIIRPRAAQVSKLDRITCNPPS